VNLSLISYAQLVDNSWLSTGGARVGNGWLTRGKRVFNRGGIDE